MSNEMTSRRVSWVALALSFLSPGVGHLYCGRIAKGLPLYFAWLLVPLCGIAATRVPPSATVLLLLLLLPAATVVLAYLYAAIDAWRIACQVGSGYSLRDYNRAGIYGLLIAVQLVYSIGLIAGVRSFVYEAYSIPTSSMSPTLLNGDRILVRKLLPPHHFPERGELVVFRNPTPSKASALVKRVVAVAGDHVEIRGERLLINGNELARDRVPAESLKLLGEQMRGRVAYEVNSGHRYLVAYEDASDAGSAQSDFEATIPEGHFFALGDNRDRSKDSRHFGSIPSGDLVGCLDYIYWPAKSWSRFGVANAWLP